LGSFIESLGTFHCRQGVNPTLQTSGLADLKGNGNSRLLGATGHRKKAIPKANRLKASRNRIFWMTMLQRENTTEEPTAVFTENQLNIIDK